MKTKTITFILLALLLALFTSPVYGQEEGIPPLPHAFYGNIEVNGSPASVGTEVEARGEGVQTGVGNNPIVVAAEGSYGSSNPLEPKLIVQGNIVEGTILTFYVNSVPTGLTAEWHSGELTELNLSATVEGTPLETTETPPPETTEAPSPTPAAFSLSSLFISPNEVALGESVTISVEVANTGEETGNCEVVLNIEGVAEASKEIAVNPGASQEVTFTTSKSLPGTYAVDISGLSGTFVVMEEELVAAPPSPPAPPAPPAPQPVPAGLVNWPVIWGVVGGVIWLGLTVFLLARRKAY